MLRIQKSGLNREPECYLTLCARCVNCYTFLYGRKTCSNCAEAIRSLRTQFSLLESSVVIQTTQVLLYKFIYKDKNSRSPII